MDLDLQVIFANVSEKERLMGHHSAEGGAIRTLSRGLNGWSAGDLSAEDVIILCDQAIEDWLKARLKVSQWSAKSVSELLAGAVQIKLLTRLDAVRLQRLHNQRARCDGAKLSAAKIEAALALCIHIVDTHWS
jgi:hypothetical protein